MQATHQFGLIGRNISYSFSKKYFSEKFRKLFLNGYSYEIFDLKDISEVGNLFRTPNLQGLNVTIPYKETIIPYLDELSVEAREIGAVNCISIKNGKKTGHNTDAFGFEKTLLLHKKPEQNAAIILGDGGAAKAVQFVLKKHGIPYISVSRRSSEYNFENLDEATVRRHSIIIQCTPVGTFPSTEAVLPFPFSGLSEGHLVIDLIYNPEVSQFLKLASEAGAKTANGFYMLEQQAERAWEIWKS